MMKPLVGRSAVVEVTVLTVADCPNGPLIEDRLAQALAGRDGVRVIRREIDSEEDASLFGMRGSPTLLIDGVDPFAMAGTPFSVSCRMYRTDDGPLEGAPSVAALRRVVQASANGTTVPGAVGRSGLGRIAPLEGGLRAVHQQILCTLAAGGPAPEASALTEVAAPYGRTAEQVLADLHTRDLLRLDEAGRVRAAYPFSLTSTAHTVALDGHAEVQAMCAVDALGMAAMLATTATIHSTDPHTGQAITVIVDPEGLHATWDPVTAVVVVGQEAGCGPCEEPDAPGAAADVCCDHINFFASPASADVWLHAHPGVTGQVLDQQAALDLGTQTFGPSLTTEP